MQRQFGYRRLQFLQRQFELGDLARQLLRRAAKMHPLQSRNLNFEFFDQQIAAEKCAFRRHARGPFGVEFSALRSHEAAQGLDVIGKRGSIVWHAKLVS